jgi:hypothetical protein
MMTGCLMTSDSLSAQARAMKSPPPPATKGTTIRKGLSGYLSAGPAVADIVTHRELNNTAILNIRIDDSPHFTLIE